ncbi:peptidyl-prolyl cis-trans isomerase-like 4 [Xenia sp. Carnegie-2017]|uniref:peptidyl-prolyl cis-trans isomerase-like 4 n=1 Tax=Xenia sp. Carnegie-2017 TaxID=2897299 RepID=UPI001F0497B9|nr:peptidyl-prolyl cis-trans isomerase-like 4 [Xenia sp. Carnegie-2017]
MSVILETTIGDLVIDLFTEERPRASLNFLKLCKVKFYNFSLFHFVQRDFLAQTGDPTGSGRGGESIFRSLYGDQARFFNAEVKPRIKHVKKGTVSMVNNGQDMHGSQFFITLGDDLDYLDGKHTVFGEVAEGFNVLEKLNETICDDGHRPYQDVRITHTVVLDDPFDDPDGLQVPDRSPEPTKEQLDSGRIGADEDIDDTKDKTVEEIEEMIEQREFKAGAQILEMVGDIPDADIKPPENVLFVCKLNPVTTDEDLEIIFSRFGSIKSCEIIRDSVSKESLQYAFIEYENVEDCERAYFKMDNVLIDDRRIHVDFSQSVAKLVHTKPGAKPVYELKSKPDHVTPKLGIKDTARKDSKRYDMVFDDEDSDEGKRKSPMANRSTPIRKEDAVLRAMTIVTIVKGNTKMTTRRNKPEKNQIDAITQEIIDLPKDLTIDVEGRTIVTDFRKRTRGKGSRMIRTVNQETIIAIQMTLTGGRGVENGSRKKEFEGWRVCEN